MEEARRGQRRSLGEMGPTPICPQPTSPFPLQPHTYHLHLFTHSFSPTENPSLSPEISKLQLLTSKAARYSQRWRFEPEFD